MLCALDDWPHVQEGKIGQLVKLDHLKFSYSLSFSTADSFCVYIFLIQSDLLIR